MALVPPGGPRPHRGSRKRRSRNTCPSPPTAFSRRPRSSRNAPTPPRLVEEDAPASISAPAHPHYGWLRRPAGPSRNLASRFEEARRGFRDAHYVRSSTNRNGEAFAPQPTGVGRRSLLTQPGLRDAETFHQGQGVGTKLGAQRIDLGSDGLAASSGHLAVIGEPATIGLNAAQPADQPQESRQAERAGAGCG